MVIPEKIKILYKDYTVIQEQNVHDGHNDLYGQISYGSQIIRIDEQYSAEQKKATLLHEILHGLDDMYQIGLGEKKVAKLGVALYQMIKDNPELFADPKEEGGRVDDIKSVVKELHRIADAGERIAKGLEKQNQILNIVPKIMIAAGGEEDAASGED